MNIQKQVNPPQPQIDQLKQLFTISLEICRERALELIQNHPKNLIVLQVLAACESLLKNYPRAIQLYQACLAIDSDCIAFLNNFAWNHIQIEDGSAAEPINTQKIDDYKMAATIFNDIKQKWSHPAIYLNLAVTYQQGKVINPLLLDEAVHKKELYRKHYPSFDEPNQQGLIHTFQLRPQQNYDQKQMNKFKEEVSETVIVFQNMLHREFNMDKITQVLEKLHPKVVEKLDQENKYGMRIQNSVKAIIEVMQGFRDNIVPCFNKQYQKEIKEYLIETIRILNSNIFKGEIDKECDYEFIHNSCVIPCLIQMQETEKQIRHLISNLIKPPQNPFNQQQKPVPEPQLLHVLPKPIFELPKPIFEPPKPIFEPPKKLPEQKVNHFENEPLMPVSSQENENPLEQKFFQIPKFPQVENEELKVRRQMDFEVKREEKEQLDEYERDDFPADIYNFYIRLNDIEEMILEEEKFIHSILRVEGDTISTPLFIILHLKKNDADIFNVYLNQTRIKNQILNQPTLPNLSNLTDPSQSNQLIKYYHVLNLVLKCYNFYGTNNFEYKLKNVKTKIELNNFVDSLTPVLNHMFEEDHCFGETKLGWVFNEIHYALAKYFQYTTSREYLKLLNTMLKRIGQICESQKSIVESLLNDILDKKHKKYREILLSCKLSEINGSTKQHFYFNWKMNRYHMIHRKKSVRSTFKEQDNWIISNVCLILITLAQKELLQEDQSILCQAFTDCFHQSGQVSSYKQQILDKFYASNHVIPTIEKVGSYLRKIIRDIAPF